MRAKSIAITCALLISGSVVVPSASCADDDYMGQLVKQGESAAAVGDWRAAAAEFVQAVQSPTWKSRALYDLAIADYHLGAFPQAIVAIKAAIQADERFGSAYIQLATILTATRDYIAAEAALKKAIQIDPQSKVARANLEQLRKVYIAAHSAIRKVEPATKAANSSGTSSDKVASKPGEQTAQNGTPSSTNSTATGAAVKSEIAKSSDKVETAQDPNVAPLVTRIQPCTLEKATASASVIAIAPAIKTSSSSTTVASQPNAASQADQASQSSSAEATKAKLPALAIAMAPAMPTSGSVSPSEILRGKALLLLGQARVALEAGEVDKAKYILKRAVNLDPVNVLAHINFGVLLGLQGDFAADAMQQRAALELDPTASLARLNLAWTLCQQERWPQALSEYNTLLNAKQLVPDATSGKALVLSKIGQAQVAVNLLTRYKRQDVKVTWPQIALSKIYLNENLNDEAMAELKDAIAKDPNNLEARKLLAVLYSKLGYWKMAAQQYVETNRRTPYDMDAFVGLASVQQHLQDNEGAVRSLRTATEIAPTNAVAHATLSSALEQAGDVSEAENEARIALKLNPKQQIAESILQRITR